ncbi:hypothetical protein Mgra_00007967 [Meloidogyne graminicola]|uniref:G-protein coupled receptors family 1 profile domain-containing protein n=1 Tax=Meloidogyne graminicola TaxID=189291 RepID=A0A8S9ZH45_9BILA|nr:hypothetical protein Mgra_00007967 [Meloidogyne graminicola]
MFSTLFLMFLFQLYSEYKNSGPSFALIIPAVLMNIAGIPGIAANLLLIFVTIQNNKLRGPTNYLLALTAFFEILHQTGHLFFLIITASGINFINYSTALYFQIHAVFGATAAQTTMCSTAADRLFSVLFPIKYKLLKIRPYLFFHTLLAIISGIWMSINAINLSIKYPTLPVTGYISDLLVLDMEIFLRFAMLLCVLSVVFYIFVWIVVRFTHSANTNVQADCQSRLLKSLILIISVVIGGYVIGCCFRLIINHYFNLNDIQIWSVNVFAGIFINIGASAETPILYIFSSLYREEINKQLNFFKKQNKTKINPIQDIDKSLFLSKKILRYSINFIMSGKKGADWFEESERDKMNMLESCKRGNLNEVAKYLSGGIDADEEDDDGVTALQIAAAKGHRRLVEFLIKEGASLEKANYAGMTPFLHACREGHQDIVTLLANYGANPNVLSGLGLSAIALACAGRHLAVVRTLKSLNVFVDLNKHNVRIHQIAPTPYMIAFFEMDIQICGFLKQQNANIWYQIKRLNGLDVVRMGQLLGLPEILMRLNYTENTLQEPSKKVDIRLVIQSGDEIELTKLIKDGEIPNNLQYGLTPLIYAAVSGQLRCAEILLKVGKGGAIDAQENVLGMTALMFAVVAGESLMVQLLLRYLANPRILSTTKEPFSALDLAMYSELNRECIEYLCIQWLNKGGSKISGIITRPRERKCQNNQQQIIPSYRGAITPARLRRAIESIGKNLIGLGNNEDGNGNNNKEKEENGGLNQNIQSSSMLRLAAENVHQLIEGPSRFVLAEHILRGDARPSGPKKSSADDLVLMARQMAISWMSRGHSLIPIITKTTGRMLLLEEGDERDSDGLYSAAQRNAEKELFKTKHRYEPSRKHSSKSTTSRVMKNAAQKC